MSTGNEFGVILFNTTTAAIRAEKAVQKAEIDAKLISTPREFSSDCGLSLKFSWDLHDQIIDVLKGKSIDFSESHKLK